MSSGVERSPTADERIEAVTVGAVPRLDGPVTLVPYDPAWPGVFAREARRVTGALRGLEHSLHHVGSTSVPGLLAKPVIDMLLTVPDPAEEASYVPALTELGYELAIREPDWYEHRVLRGSDLDPAADTANLHVLPAGCAEVDRMLAFRDRLRAHPEERDRYAATKRELARRTWAYTQHYADAKTEVVEAILSRAARGDR